MPRSLLKTLLALAALVAAARARRAWRRRRRGKRRHRRHARAERGRRRRECHRAAVRGHRDRNLETREGKKGGKLTVLSAGDVDYMDPGKTYYSYGSWIRCATSTAGSTPTCRTTRDSPCRISPTATPEISEDGKTVTVKIKKGVKFSKPVNREVTSQDVKYAIERAFTSNVSNGYARVYFGDIVGAPKEPGDVQGDPGHRDARRPDDRLQAHQGHGRGARRRAGAADLRSGAEGVRREVRQGEPVDVRRAPAVSTGPVHGRERRRAARPSATSRARRIHLVRNPDYAHGRRLPARRSSTRSTSRPATTTRPSATRRILDGREPGRRRHRAAGEPAQAAAGDQQDRAVRCRRAAAGA